jgi:hypothetical protein
VEVRQRKLLRKHELRAGSVRFGPNVMVTAWGQPCLAPCGLLTRYQMLQLGQVFSPPRMVRRPGAVEGAGRYGC